MDYILTNEEFEEFRALVYRESGISLSDGKKSLIVSRLAARVRTLGLSSFQAYLDLMVGDRGRDEVTEMLNLISTNKTDFFREPAHFSFLRDHILPGLEVTKQVRVWSSACSSGEEPYTIGMVLLDSVAAPSRWDFQILASDISTRMLSHAAAGIYEEGRVKGIPGDVVRRHFLKGRGAHAGYVKVKPYLSRMVRFRRLNLMDEHYPIGAPVDVIFCRNVLINFDRPTQEQLMAKFHRYLKPGGYLLIGHSESLQWIGHSFQSVAPTIYRKED